MPLPSLSVVTVANISPVSFETRLNFAPSIALPSLSTLLIVTEPSLRVLLNNAVVVIAVSVSVLYRSVTT